MDIIVRWHELVETQNQRRSHLPFQAGIGKSRSVKGVICYVMTSGKSRKTVQIRFKPHPSNSPVHHPTHNALDKLLKMGTCGPDMLPVHLPDHLSLQFATPPPPSPPTPKKVRYPYNSLRRSDLFLQPHALAASICAHTSRTCARLLLPSQVRP